METAILRENVIYEDNSTKISSTTNNYGFTTISQEQYKELFHTLVEKGIIEETLFNSDNWIAINLSTRTKTTINFNTALNRDLKLALKAYSVSFLSQGFSVSHIQSTIHNFIKLYFISNSFSEEHFNNFLEEFNKLTSRQKENYSLAAIRIYEFHQNVFIKKYYDFFKSTPTSERKVRSLPNYNSILSFDEIINSFMNTATLDEKKKFYPVYIWWRITSVIPLRPEEFVSLTYESVFEEANTYWIKVPRKKERNSNNALIKIEDTLKIPQEIFLIIEDYKSLLNEDEISEYLFSYMSYFKFLKESHKKQSLNRRVRTDRIDKCQLETLLTEFTEKIVKERYKEYNISKINLGDTRHFAFCNMMLQGLNMLTIARIGGHQHLNSQVHYSQHLDFFAESKARVLSEQIKRNRIRDIGNLVTPEINTLVIRSKLNEPNGLKVKGGYCNDNDFPNNCNSECLFCPFFQLDLSKKNVLKELLDKSNQIGRNISDQIATMQKLSREMIYDLHTMQYSAEEQEKLLSLSKKLDDLIKKKAILDSYINKEGLDNE